MGLRIGYAESNTDSERSHFMSSSSRDENRSDAPHSPAARTAAPPPARALPSDDAVDKIKIKVQNWADEAYEEYARTGDLQRLPGFGKPLVVPTGDPLSRC
ncbi:hypothetical protein [Gordoniibacillus kamchatkensis]|uniref:hypothetical protein n=1 Tax=Gordoniibacillus kamchatkensis TaxID=1590651 RepID=UPI00069704BF|nr:hypothetical protein [Paenibacillus sp. VKM B-2647]